MESYYIRGLSPTSKKVVDFFLDRAMPVIYFGDQEKLNNARHTVRMGFADAVREHAPAWDIFPAYLHNAVSEIVKEKRFENMQGRKVLEVMAHTMGFISRQKDAREYVRDVLGVAKEKYPILNNLHNNL